MPTNDPFAAKRRQMRDEFFDKLFVLGGWLGGTDTYKRTMWAAVPDVAHRPAHPLEAQARHARQERLPAGEAPDVHRQEDVVARLRLEDGVPHRPGIGARLRALGVESAGQPHNPLPFGGEPVRELVG